MQSDSYFLTAGLRKKSQKRQSKTVFSVSSVDKLWSTDCTELRLFLQVALRETKDNLFAREIQSSVREYCAIST